MAKKNTLTSLLSILKEDAPDVKLLLKEAQRQNKLAAEFQACGNTRGGQLCYEVAWAHGLSAIWLRVKKERK